MSPAAQTVLDELEETRARWWLYTLMYNLSITGALSILLLWSAVTADWRWGLSVETRISLFFGWCVVSLGMLAMTLTYALARQRTLSAAARRLEMVFPELESDLINLVQLAELPVEDPFCVAAAEEAARRVEGVPFGLAPYNFSSWRRWRLGMHTGGDLCGAIGVLLVLLALSLSMYYRAPHWSNSLNRLLLPWRTVKSVRVERKGQEAKAELRSVERAIAEAAQVPDPVEISMPAVLAKLHSPIEQICNRLGDIRERVIVETSLHCYHGPLESSGGPFWCRALAKIGGK